MKNVNKMFKILYIFSFVILFSFVSCSDHQSRIRNLQLLSFREDCSYENFVDAANKCFKRSSGSFIYDIYYVMCEKMKRDENFLIFCKNLNGDPFVENAIFYYFNDYSQRAQ